MALSQTCTPVYCPECETRCSGKASACPHCGHPLSEPQRPLITVIGKPKWVIASSIVGLVLTTFIYYQYQSHDTHQIIVVNNPTSQSDVYTPDLNSITTTPDVAVRNVRSENALLLLESAKQFPIYHDKKMWIFATWMVHEYYTWNDAIVPLSFDNIIDVFSGNKALTAPDTDPFELTWYLASTYENLTNTSWLRLTCDEEYSYKLEHAFIDEWFNAKTYVITEDHKDYLLGLDNFISNGFELWKRDNHPEYFGKVSREDTDDWIKREPFKVVRRERETDYPRYWLDIQQEINQYRFRFHLAETDAWANEAPSTILYIDFIYIPAVSVMD